MTEFIRHAISGKVHVAIEAAARPAWWDRTYERRPLYRELFPRDDPAVELAMQPVPCRCGLLAIRPSDGRYYGYTEAFDDDQLCVMCWRATSAEERAGLFEHAHPIDLDEVVSGDG